MEVARASRAALSPQRALFLFSLAFLTAGGSSCALYKQASEARLDRYHQRQWAAVTAEYYGIELRERDYDTPRECRKVLAPLYSQARELAGEVRVARQAQLDRGPASAKVAGDMLLALRTKNPPNILDQRPRLKSELAEQASLQAAVDAASAKFVAHSDKIVAAWEGFGLCTT